MMKNDEKMMENDEKWWKMMKNDEKWWKMMKNTPQKNAWDV